MGVNELKEKRKKNERRKEKKKKTVEEVRVDLEDDQNLLYKIF